MVSLRPRAGKERPFSPIDSRVSAPDVEGKTTNPHLREMCGHALDQTQLRARTILFDGGYAAAENLKVIHRQKRTFFTPLKSNRWVSLSKEHGSLPLAEVEWTPERLTHGVLGKVKEVPFMGRFFKLGAPDGDIDWVMTKDRAETGTRQVAKDASDGRWQVEELHRGLKQLPGTAKGQWRAARAQRTHLACC